MSRVIIGDNLDEYSYPLHMMGYASTLPAGDDYDPADEVCRIAEEVTGKKFDGPEPRRIGFL